MHIEAHEDSIFDLDSEQLEALKIEAQAIPPDEQEAFELLVSQVHASFLRLFSGLTSFDIDSEQMVSKFISTDPDSYHEFVGRWQETRGKVFERYMTRKGQAQAFANDGNFVIASEDRFDDFISQQDWESMLQNTGLPEDELMSLVRNILDATVIAHEMTHLYQFPTNLTPLWLLEGQAYWATTKMLKHSLSTRATDAIANFYQYLLDKYGDKVHRLCFGASESSKLSESIKAEFTPEIQAALFPEYFVGDISQEE